MRATASRLRRDEGLGLVELLIAMTVLAIGILALVAGLSSGYVTLRRANTQATASALADQQMERYRGLRYADIALNGGLSVDSTYTSDSAYPGTAVTGCATSAPECTPMQASVTGADGRSYRVDTFIRWSAPTGGRQLKLVTVVVRQNGKEWARTQSTFDRCTGVAPTDTTPCSA